MRAAAGLAVDQAFVADADEPDAARALRRAHILGFDQPRIGGKVSVADLAYENRMIGPDQLHSHKPTATSH